MTIYIIWPNTFSTILYPPGWSFWFSVLYNWLELNDKPQARIEKVYGQSEIFGALLQSKIVFTIACFYDIFIVVLVTERAKQAPHGAFIEGHNS